MNMPFAYYRKLSPRQRRIYRESDRIEKIEIHQSFLYSESVAAVEAALATGNRSSTREAAQKLMDRLTASMGVPPLRVEVGDRRPRWASGELHGLYEPAGGPRQRVSVWMRTARRAQIIRFRTFLRTVVHELCHHLDYERFGLEESFHTEGFYKRESSLLRQLHPGPAHRREETGATLS
ncbi:MAG: hypothetical protein ACE5JI_15210 [Acidobacteriota bacterium]